MTDAANTIDDKDFRLKTGAVIRAGWLQRDLPFLTRSLRFLLRPESAKLREDTGLDAGDIGVLAIILLNPDISQNDLAASLVLKKSAVTRVVQRLERRGLLNRRRSTTDRRANRLTLTDEGQALAFQLRDKTEALHGEWFQDVSDQDVAVFFDVLFSVIAVLAAKGGQGLEDGDDD